MKKKFSLMFIASFSAMAISTPLSLEKNATILDNSLSKINELNNIINQKSNEKGILEGDFCLDKYNGVKPYQEGVEIDLNIYATNSNMLCSGKNGYIVSWTNGRGVNLLSYTGKTLWSWNSTWSNFEIKDAIYLPRCDKYVVTYFSLDYGFRFITLDPDSGKLYMSSNWDSSLITTDNRYSSRICTIPVLSDSGSVTDKFIVYQRDWLSSSNQKCYVEVKVNSDGTYTSKKVSLVRSAQDEDYSILSAGSVQIGNDVYLVSANIYQSKNIWMTVYKNGTFLYEKDTGIDASWNSNRDEFLTTVDELSSDIDVYYKSGNIYINWYSNVTTSNYIKSYSFSTSSNPSSSNFNDKSISLQPSNAMNFDMDAYNVTYNNGIILARGKIFSGANKGDAILKINSRASSGNTWTQNNFNPDNKSYDSLYSIYKYTGDLDYTSKKLIPLLSYSSTEQYSQNLALFCIDQNSDMRKSFQVIKDDGNYAYQTKLKNQEIYLEGLQNTLAYGVSEEIIKSKLTLKTLLNNFTSLKTTSTISITTIKNNTTESQTLYSQGKIKGTIKITESYNGNSAISEKTFDVIFTGFKTISQTSTKVNEISVNGSLASKSVDQTNESEILTWVRDNYTSIFNEETLPYQFAKNNITSISIKSKYSYEGSINIGININSHYNNSSYLSSSKEFALKLKGFKSKDLQTTVNSNTSVSNDNSLSTLIPSSVSETKIKEIIVNNLLVNAPSSLSTSDITSVNYTIDNLRGTITISQIIVNKYQDSNGNLVNSSKTFNGSYVISGFQTGDLQTTVKANTSISGDNSLSTLIPSSVTETKIKEIIVNNLLVNSPANLSASDVTSVNYTINNSQGTITISQIIINKYQDSNGNLANSSKTFNGSYVISGFQTGDLQTTVKANTSVSGDSSLLALIPSSVTEDKIKEIIVGNLLTNAPANLSASDVTSINYTIDNLRGTITISQITVNKYQDSNGNVVNSSKTFNGSYVISGFQTGDLQTTVKANTSVSGDNLLSTLIPSSVTETKIKEIIVNNLLVNSPANLSASDVTSVNYTINNSQGTITISQIIINKYQDSNGNLANSSKTFNGSYVISGFQTGDLQTIVKSNTSVSGDNSLSTLIPSSVTEAKIKEIIINNLLVNSPENFSSNNITSIKYVIDNLQGTITISQIIVNKYQDSNGNSSNYEKIFNGNYVISGFQKITTTQLEKDTIEGSSLQNTNINDITTNDLKKWVYSNRSSIFTQLPNNFTEDNIEVYILYKDSQKGNMVISIILDNFYDDNGNVGTGVKKQFELTITNLNSVSEEVPLSNKSEIPLWIWIAIGGGTLFLFLILIIIIASKKKNKNKRKSSQHNRPNLSPPPIGINQQNKIGFNSPKNNNKSISNNQQNNTRPIPPARKIPNAKPQKIGVQANSSLDKQPSLKKSNVSSMKTNVQKK